MLVFERSQENLALTTLSQSSRIDERTEIQKNIKKYLTTPVTSLLRHRYMYSAEVALQKPGNTIAALK